MSDAARVRHDMMLREPDLTLRYSEILHEGRKYRFNDAGRITRKRAATFLTKEPSTLKWINTFAKADTYLDVGANIGVYAVYAGVRVGCPVYAFEPEALNYAELAKNLHLNKLDRVVRAYCCGLSDRCGAGELFLSRFVTGFSHHDCAENRWEGPVTTLTASPESRPRQGCVLMTLDKAVEYGWLPVPAHIKIDVDGLEDLVLTGARNTLCRPGVKTVMVETDLRLRSAAATIDTMTRLGWTRHSVVPTNGHLALDPETVVKRIAERNGIYNVFYYHDPDYEHLFGL